jgi:ABC-type multidrug transport system ATPase subunit/pSer/pThr/pTyr-binding forkhead associated (FHA) protein
VLAAQVGAQHATAPLHVRTRQSALTLDNSKSEYRIGRDPNADISLDDSRVSWSHAVLRVEGGTWILEDRGSTNGTWLGIDRMNRLEVTSLCVIRLGDAAEGPVLRLEPGQAPAQPAPQPQPFQGQQPGFPGGPGGYQAPGYQGQQPAGYQGPPPQPAPQQPAPQYQQPFPGQPAGFQGGGHTPQVGGYQPQGAGFTPAPGAGPGAGFTPGAGQGGPPPQLNYTPSPQPDLSQPSALFRPTGRYQVQARALKIGRLPANDIVVDDLGVSRVHAELRPLPGGRYELADLGSHNGTFVNGHRIDKKILAEQTDIVSIGHSTFVLVAGQLLEYVDEGGVSFTAEGLKVFRSDGKKGTKLTLDIDFPVPEKCLMAVVGPSGAGKSTLLGALTGFDPATEGMVLYDNRDLYTHYAELRHRIGLVPQKDIVHLQLTAREALDYAAELRFSSDTARAERDTRVVEVIEELGLTAHAQTRADRLSGGQLKRVSVAMELLTKPSLLFLDEPTSGLDPGLDLQVMTKMKELAQDGRTVIVVTHSTENLGVCDRLLVLAKGGKIAYYGPPSEGLQFFGKNRWPEVFVDLNEKPDFDWAGQYKGSPYYQKYVASTKPRQQPQAQPTSGPVGAAQKAPSKGFFGQTTTLARRYTKVLAADKGFLYVSAILPIVLGGLVIALGGAGLQGTGSNAGAITQLLILVVCACLAGAANSVRELVRERPIYIRERAAGQSAAAYLLSKAMVLGVISSIQSVVILGIGLGRSYGKLPPSGAVLHGSTGALLELLIVMVVLSVSSMCLGLMLSSLVPTNEIAMPILVGITMVQVVLSGGVGLSVYKIPLAWLFPSYWGMSALASTVNLNFISPHTPGASLDPFWDQTTVHWAMNIAGLVVLGLVFLCISWWRLVRLTPGRRK